MTANPIKKIKRTVQAIITDDAPAHNLLKALLYLFSLLFSVLVRFRQKLYQWKIVKTKKLPCAVIAVGNITVGGTGKTPATVNIARAIQKRGFTVAILSRGYGGTKEKSSAVVSDGNSVLLTATEAGDEPYLMARLLPRTPVVVGADRYAGGSLAIKRFKPDVILLDDAYQHVKLERDLNCLLMDAVSPIGNGHLLPRGPLREPRAACRRADIIIYTRSNTRQKVVDDSASTWLNGNQPAFHCSHKTMLRAIIPKGEWNTDFSPRTTMGEGPINDLAEKSFFAFSGLARNNSFQRSLEKIGWQLAGSMGFEDHHWYVREDMDAINAQAVSSGARYIVTTDKDAVRIPDYFTFIKDVVVVGVELDFGIEDGPWEKFWDIWLRHHRT